jgi:hypothetical protein
VGDPEVVGKLLILGDNADIVDGGKPEGLDGREQRGVIDKDCNRGNFDREPGGYLVLGAILSATEGVDADVLVGVLVVLINARGFWEDDCGRDVLLVVKIREQQQGTGRQDRGEREDWVVERSGWAQTSVCFCGGFYRGRSSSVLGRASTPSATRL